MFEIRTWVVSNETDRLYSCWQKEADINTPLFNHDEEDTSYLIFIFTVMLQFSENTERDNFLIETNV